MIAMTIQKEVQPSLDFQGMSVGARPVIMSTTSLVIWIRKHWGPVAPPGIWSATLMSSSPGMFRRRWRMVSVVLTLKSPPIMLPAFVPTYRINGPYFLSAWRMPIMLSTSLTIALPVVPTTLAPVQSAVSWYWFALGAVSTPGVLPWPMVMPAPL